MKILSTYLKRLREESIYPSLQGIVTADELFNNSFEVTEGDLEKLRQTPENIAISSPKGLSDWEQEEEGEDEDRATSLEEVNQFKDCYKLIYKKKTGKKEKTKMETLQKYSKIKDKDRTGWPNDRIL